MMKLFHTLPVDYYQHQMRDTGFHCYYDTRYKNDTPLGIWCCDNPLSSCRACQSQDQQLITIEIHADELQVENLGDFLNKRNGDYYIIRERVIPTHCIVELKEAA
jgi:hypothetical protein